MFRWSSLESRRSLASLVDARHIRPRAQGPLKRLVLQSAVSGSLVSVGLFALITALLLPLHYSHAEGLIATSESHTCALTKSSDAGVRCWGKNSSGQLGDGTVTQRHEPVAVVGLSSGVSAVGAGLDFSCALLTSGEVRCWGANDHGQLGTGPDRDPSLVPVTVLTSGGAPLTNVTSLSVGQLHVCAVLSSGGAKCWGNNANGQLGDGTVFSRDFPVDVSGFASAVLAIDAGSHHTCLASNHLFDNVYCFGDNSFFQFGDGTTDSSLVPKLTPDLNNVIEVSAGDQHSCARQVNGNLYCWGSNGQGQLGDGTVLSRGAPVIINNFGGTPSVERVSAGIIHTCAIIEHPAEPAGEAMCWGRGFEGQIGDGTNTQRNAPTGLSPQVKLPVDISSQGVHSCAWKAECSVACWGGNSWGQIGDGTTTNAPSPVDISICSVEPTPTYTPTYTHTPTPTPPPGSSPTVSPTATAAPADFTPLPVVPSTGSLPAPSVTVNGTSATVLAPVLTLQPGVGRGLSLFGYRFTVIASRSSRAIAGVRSFQESTFEVLSRAAAKRRQYITKRNTITLRKLGKGTYRVTYQAVFRNKQKKGSKTIFGKMSAARVFTVR